MNFKTFLLPKVILKKKTFTKNLLKYTLDNNMFLFSKMALKTLYFIITLTIKHSNLAKMLIKYIKDGTVKGAENVQKSNLVWYKIVLQSFKLKDTKLF